MGGNATNRLSAIRANPDSPADAIAVVFRRHPRARHYKLRVGPDGQVMVTIPRGGSCAEAVVFVEKHRNWIQREQGKRKAQPHGQVWRPGTSVLFRGELSVLALERVHARPFVVFSDQRVPIADPEMDFKRPVCEHLWGLARRELPVRLSVLAAALGIAPLRTTVRNQATLWGSCSHAGTISLNWRLVQAPFDVRDYVIVHELMHRIEMNHSARFWKLVAEACPEFQRHENWLKAHAGVVGL